jgi:hypothetical protein
MFGKIAGGGDLQDRCLDSEPKPLSYRVVVCANTSGMVSNLTTPTINVRKGSTASYELGALATTYC